MNTLAEYFHTKHPVRGVSPHAYIRPEPLFTMVPTASITQIKGFVLLGIVLAAILPPQYAWLVTLFANGYWMFKL